MAEITQRIVICSQGHYFDSNSSDTCPVCGERVVSGFNKGSGSGSFTPTLDPSQVGHVYGGGRPVAYASDGQRSANDSASGKTVIPSSYAAHSSSAGGQERYQAPSSGLGVTEAVQNVHKGAFSHTIAIDNSTKPGHVAPVVGWFVAVSGPCRGTDYRIHTNYNYIGREEGDICVHGDQAISAVRDSSIAYVAKTDKFYIAHEQGLNTVLVNDEPVMGAGRELKALDIVTIGSTQFVFIPLCGPNFSWGDWPSTGGE